MPEGHPPTHPPTHPPQTISVEEVVQKVTRDYAFGKNKPQDFRLDGLLRWIRDQKIKPPTQPGDATLALLRSRSDRVKEVLGWTGG